MYYRNSSESIFLIHMYMELHLSNKMKYLDNKLKKY